MTTSISTYRTPRESIKFVACRSGQIPFGSKLQQAISPASRIGNCIYASQAASPNCATVECNGVRQQLELRTLTTLRFATWRHLQDGPAPARFKVRVEDVSEGDRTDTSLSQTELSWMPVEPLARKRVRNFPRGSYTAPVGQAHLYTLFSYRQYIFLRMNFNILCPRRVYIDADKIGQAACKIHLRERL